MLCPPRQLHSVRAIIVAALIAAAVIAVACGDGLPQHPDPLGHRNEQELVEKLFSAQANELGVYDLDTNAKTVLIQSHDSAPDTGHDVNGQVCLLPDGSGDFLMGEDTNQGDGDRQGWGVFSSDGTLQRKLLEPISQGEADQVEPFGCAFDSDKRLFVTDVGDGSFDAEDGKLILFFPPNYDTSCVLDSALHVAGTVAIDDDGDVVVPQTVPPGEVLKFAPPFPATAEECTTVPANKSVFLQDPDVLTPFSIVKAPNGNWYLSSVFLPTTIREYDAQGTFVRTIVEGEDIGNPAGLAVASDGTIYYADLGLEAPPGELPGPAPGKGTVRKITFDANGNPQAPETIASGYDYPDAVSILRVKE